MTSRVGTLRAGVGALLALFLAACGSGGPAAPIAGPGPDAGRLDLPASPVPPDLAVDVGSYQLLSTERAGRTEFLYTYRVNVVNAGGNANNVRGSVSSSSLDTVVVDGGVSFGNVGAGGTVTGSDTFQIRQNRLVPFDPAALSWSVAFDTPSAPATPASIAVLAASPQLPSDRDGATTVQITALVTDTSNAPVADVAVSFGASSGSVLVTQPRTNAAGVAVAQLSNGTSAANRIITVEARTGALVAAIAVAVTGTTVALSGPAALALGEVGPYAITVRDSRGAGIPDVMVAAESAAGNALSATSLTTDGQGAAVFQVTRTQPGNDTLTVRALGDAAVRVVGSRDDGFVFDSPAAGTEIALGVSRDVAVRWTRAGIPKAGETIRFATTRGNLSAFAASTNSSGQATVSISAGSAGPAGPAVVTAVNDEGTAISLPIEFVATTPASVDLIATPLSVVTGAQAQLVAVIRDAAGNRVKNRLVEFLIQADSTGGVLTEASATTDNQGEVRTTYIAGSTPSAANGVQIRARDQGTGIFADIALTVVRQELSLALGTGNMLFEIGTAAYAKEWVVLVTDGEGNPVGNKAIQVATRSRRYFKGQLEFTAPLWRYAGDGSPLACADEDSNQDGILDPGEDVNGNGSVEAGNIALVEAVPESAPAQEPCAATGSAGVTANVVTNPQGRARFCVLYPRNFAQWVDVGLTARGSASGVEFSRSVVFRLDGLASDLDDPDTTPQNLLSPFGPARVPDGTAGDRPATCADPPPLP